MNSIKTNNIISTPDITGNIGSCTSQSVKVETGYNLLKKDFKTIVTNSCTGEVTIYDSWSLGGFPWAVVILGILVFYSVIAMNISEN